MFVGGRVFDCDLGEVGCACEGFPAGLFVKDIFGLYNMNERKWI